jgi:hypothetical protein
MLTAGGCCGRLSDASHLGERGKYFITSMWLYYLDLSVAHSIDNNSCWPWLSVCLLSLMLWVQTKPLLFRLLKIFYPDHFSQSITTLTSSLVSKQPDKLVALSTAIAGICPLNITNDIIMPRC